jgi:PKD repeat protein
VGTYTVTLTVTDNGDLTDTFTTDTIDVSEEPEPPSNTIHVGDLDGEGVKLTKGHWKAVVTITIHDGSHNGVNNVQVFGTFWQKGQPVIEGVSSDYSGGNGICTIDSGILPGKGGTATFVVDYVVPEQSYSYDSVLNHDPDGDSDGTEIIISK